jgi:hypothetical protein
LDFVGNELVGVLEIGDNLVANVKDGNLGGVAFYLILCTKALHKVKDAFIDIWGTSFDVGDDVVASIYYHKWENNDSSYVLLKDSHVVYVYSHLVGVGKFLMPPKNHRVNGNDVVYELLEDILQGINEVIVSLEVDD